MAVWQFKCNIIPKRKNTENLTQDDLLSWKGASPPARKIDFLRQVPTWTPNIVQYGKSDETCLEFIFDDNVLEEIECRLDLRNLTKAMLSELLEYVEKSNAMFWVDGEVYAPELTQIVEVMKHSDANLFCTDPQKYILIGNTKKE